MFKLRQVLRYEGLLLLRSKTMMGFLILFALFWLGAVGFYEVTDLPNTRAGFFYELLFRWYVLWVMLLVAGLVGTYLAQKDHSSRFEQLLLVWKVKNSEWLIGKWLVVQAYGAVLTLMTLIIFGGWLATGNYDLKGWLQHMAFVFLNVGGAVFFFSTLCFWLGKTIKNRLVYLLIPVLWVAMSWIQIEVAGHSSLNPRLRLLAPYFTEYYFSPFGDVFELSGNQSLVWLHQSAVLLFGVALMLLMLLLYRKHRQEGAERRYGRLGLVIAIVPALLLTAWRLQMYEGKLEQHVQFAQARMVLPENNENFYEQTPRRLDTQFSMDRTDLQVTLLGGNRITVNAVLTATYHGTQPTRQLDLALFGDLKVQEVRAKNDAAIVWEQVGDSINVTLSESVASEESIELAMRYEGSVLQTDWDAFASTSFAEEGRVFLRKGSGWYPLIGKREFWKAREHNNRYLNFELREVTFEEPSPTEFTVQIEQAEELDAVLAMSIAQTGANTFAGRATDLALVGGHLTAKTVEGVRVYAHPDVIAYATAEVQAKLQGWNYMERLLGVQQAPQAVFVIGASAIQPTSVQDSLLQYWSVYTLGRKADMYYYKTDYLVQLPLDPAFFTSDGQYAYHLDLLVNAIKWAVRKEFQDTHDHNRFVEFYTQTYFWDSQHHLQPEEEALRKQAERWIETIGRYDEQGPREYEALIRFLYKQYKLAQTPEDFDMAKALTLYEQGGAAQ
ncbi:hypothetical protein CIG75_10055 [Tumebacillus algifaecis]|uniref:Uncharacterized protein n=1 Tax=Tumebacillus algifaecis TaxID=1214604 RepID=A0A223D1N9_9BACL|nr:ABC transporter permease [Tumebacillus algifaecis]ASS75297.1 hypothetical protein CIG75_10055 [Tumebacillus algifaecis]